MGRVVVKWTDISAGIFRDENFHPSAVQCSKLEERHCDSSIVVRSSAGTDADHGNGVSAVKSNIEPAMLDRGLGPQWLCHWVVPGNNEAGGCAVVGSGHVSNAASRHQARKQLCTRHSELHVCWRGIRKRFFQTSCWSNSINFILDACTGDGGSPLVCQNGGRWYVMGLVAWGIGCGTSNVPGVYVNIPSYLSWIQSAVQS